MSFDPQFDYPVAYCRSLDSGNADEWNFVFRTLLPGFIQDVGNGQVRITESGWRALESRPKASGAQCFKYRPDFPDRFGSAQHGRSHCGPFFDWYNHEHRHGGIGLLTPHDVHYGLADQRVAARARVLAAAHAAHPERFPAGVPSPPPAPTAVWINPPTLTSSDVEEAH